MFARTKIARGLPQTCSTVTPVVRRGLAAQAASPFHYTVGDANGVKIASRDDASPTTTLAVVVRGGSRYQSAPGLAHGLAQFAFKNTHKRSALRLTRETELLGGVFSSTHSRENIVLTAKFLREDLPYFTEAVGDVLSKTRYTTYEFAEEVAPVIHHDLDVYAHSPAAIAFETAVNTAFHTGLGNKLLAVSSKFIKENSITSQSIPEYAQKVYQKGNLAVVASGAEQSLLKKYVSEHFAEVAAGNGAILSTVSKYFGGENRTYSDAGNSLLIAFPGSQGGAQAKAEYTVLAYLLGGKASTKWNAGTSLLSQAVADITGVSAVAKHTAYTDAGLLSIAINGPIASLRKAAENVVKATQALASVKAEDVKKAIAQAKFDTLAAAEDRTAGLELIGQSVIASGQAPQVDAVVKALEAVTLKDVQAAAKKILEGKATYTAVGDLHALPFASELGLRV